MLGDYKNIPDIPNRDNQDIFILSFQRIIKKFVMPIMFLVYRYFVYFLSNVYSQGQYTQRDFVAKINLTFILYIFYIALWIDHS